MNCKQDMPPPGGYASITYKRVPLKPGWSSASKIAALFCTSGLGLAGFHYTKNKLNREKLEIRCAEQAVSPLILAELDRIFLKQIRKNRENEEKLMKDVENWEVGKWEHLPVYLSLEPDEFFKPNYPEYFAHSDLNIIKIINSFKSFF